MKKLIITHGNFASGIKGALQVIVGDVSNIDTIDAFVDERSLKDLVKEYMETVDLEHEKLLVFTDLPAGSVNQYFVTHYSTENVYIVSGINLPLILELSLTPGEFINEDTIRNAVDMAKEQVVFVEKTELVDTPSGDDFDF